MFVPFESMAPSSRVWVYQANRKFSDQDKAIISEQLELFTNEWAAHGQPLKASFDIRYNQFVILAADEGFNEASGCSIDSSVRTFKELSQRLNIDFFDRNLVAFKIDGNVELVAVQNLANEYREGKWTQKTPMFNNVINTKSQLDREWVIPAETSWLKRYIPKPTLAN